MISCISTFTELERSEELFFKSDVPQILRRGDGCINQKFVESIVSKSEIHLLPDTVSSSAQFSD